MVNRLGATCWMVVCGIALLVSCGGKDSHGIFVPPSDDGGASGSTNHRAGAGGASGAAGSGARAGNGGTGGGTDSALAPKIKITAPSPASDPNVDEVLIDDQVTVVCQATKSTAVGAAAVDASTVKIAMLDANGKELKSASGTPTENNNEYSAAFVLEAVANGAVSFQCTASDTAEHTGSATVETLVDHGPEIDVIEPVKASAHNLLAPMAIEFDTAAVPIAKGDKQAAVSGVTIAVYGVDIKPVAAGNGKYKATVDFTKFDAKPSGTVPVVLTASNSRKAPGNATQSVSYTIVLDGTGPTIALVTPGAQAVVGRSTILKFTASDVGAGVDNATVTVKLNDTPFVYSATNGKWTVDTAGLFTFQFGAEVKNASNTQVLVNISASDKAGNSGKASTIYNLDNQPPIVDMDPPNLYEVKLNSTPADTKQCSDYFDPVGTEAPNDKQTITNFGNFRAVVYDDTNTTAGQTTFYFAQTDHNSVQIFVQDDPNSPLLADDDNDGICDEIWTGTAPHQKKPTDKPIPFVGLHMVAPTTYRGSVTYTNPVNTPVTEGCSGGVASSAPKLCKDGASDMSVVIHHGASKDESVIYAIDPVDSSESPVCSGQPWNVPTAITANGGMPQLGWVCIAARAVDTVGNVGISRPLRICLDDGTKPDRCDGIALPTCTDNCTPPPHFNQLVSHL